MLSGVPIEVLSGLSGLEMDNCRCLRLREDFLRTCGRCGTLDAVGDPDMAMPSAPVGIWTSAGVPGDPVRADSLPGLTEGIGELDWGKKLCGVGCWSVDPGGLKTESGSVCRSVFMEIADRDGGSTLGATSSKRGPAVAGWWAMGGMLVSILSCFAF